MSNNFSSLLDICSILEEIRNVNGNKAKEKILKDNSNNELLRKILQYTYDTDFKYGIKKTTIEKMKFNTQEKDKWNTNLWDMLEELKSSNINNQLIQEVEKLISYFPNDKIKDLIVKIILKDQKIGCNIKTINKCIPGLIPTFDLMKASSYDDKSKKTFCNKAKKVGYHMMIKENGIRGIITVKGNDIVIKTRQNQVLEGMDELIQAFRGMDNGIYEGEMLAVGEFKTSKEQFKATTKILSTKGKKKGIMIKLFDYITLDEFNCGYSDIGTLERKRYLEDTVQNHNEDLIKMVTILYVGKDTDKIEPTLEEVSKDDKYEGLMVQLNNAPYEAKRVKTELKVKQWRTMDLEVIGLKESKEKPNTLGSLILDFKGREQGCSGIADELKDLWWNNPEEIIGKIIECKYKEITNDKDGNEALQFCTFVRVRNDKTKKDISYD